MSRFMMLLYDDAENLQRWERMTPEEMQAVIERYDAWAGGLAAEGKLAGGEKLRDGQGRVVRGAGASRRTTDGPFAETREVVGGYFLLDAADYDEAVRLAGGCPHLEYGGTVEIREIEPTAGAAAEGAPAAA